MNEKRAELEARAERVWVAVAPEHGMMPWSCSPTRRSCAIKMDANWGNLWKQRGVVLRRATLTLDPVREPHPGNAAVKARRPK